MRTLALKLRRNQTEKWREREVFHVMTRESGPSCCDVRGPSCCDVRERSFMLWRKRVVRHVVTSERSVRWHQREVRHAVTWERGPSCCDIREVHHVVTWERGPSCCDVREVRHALTWERGPSCCDIRERSVMLWRKREVRHVVTRERSVILWREGDPSCCDVREVPRYNVIPILWRQGFFPLCQLTIENRFPCTQSTGKSHAVGANIQTVLSMMKNHNPTLCNAVTRVQRQYAPSSGSSSSHESEQGLEELLLGLQDEFGHMSL